MSTNVHESCTSLRPCCLPDENFGLTQTTQKTQNLFARSNGLEFTEIANCCALAGLPDEDKSSHRHRERMRKGAISLPNSPWINLEYS